MRYDIFIDESCHLQNDKSNVMAIGYIKIPSDQRVQLSHDLKVIKQKHFNPYEIKWNTLSHSRIHLYNELIDFFFAQAIDFRCILIKYKEKLDHDSFNEGSHDNFYYKMVYLLLNNPWVNSQENEYRVFLDYKDTLSRSKILKIQEVMNNKFGGNSPFVLFQSIRSEESVFIQLADLFIGAITYRSRGMFNPDPSTIKNQVISYIETRTGYHLDEGTEPWETKFNIFDHQPKAK